MRNSFSLFFMQRPFNCLVISAKCAFTFHICRKGRRIGRKEMGI